MKKGEQALMEIRAHEGICTERYGNISKELTDIKNVLQTQSVQYNDRFNGLSNRMWSVLIASLGGLAVAVGVLVYYLITKS